MGREEDVLTMDQSAGTQASAPARPALLERLGLRSVELRAWALYDWANSAFMTTIVAAVFPIYYARVAAAGLDEDTAAFRFGIATTIALALVAVSSPVLGAMADRGGTKKRFLAVFVAVGVLATLGLALVESGDWLLALLLFMLANMGMYGSLTFYDSLLPHIAKPEELDRVSSVGYALGYLGGGLLLAVNLAWIQRPEWFGLRDASMATRLSFVSVAVWWTLFALPLFRRVPEPRVLDSAARPLTLAQSVGDAFGRVGETLAGLRRYQHAFLMLLAFLLYNDGIGTIIRMATLYGTQIGIDQGSLIAALLMVQFVGVPFTVVFGRFAGRIGAKRAIFLALGVYVVISVLAFAMRTAAHFFTLAFLVGIVQGGSQALSRSLFASMIPRRKSSQFFGFFGVFEKFGNVFGPLLFALAVALTGSTRTAILSVVLFFVLGGVALSRVDVPRGQQIAREEDAETAPMQPPTPDASRRRA
jgi:MFS transporter, UMF1 family